MRNSGSVQLQRRQHAKPRDGDDAGSRGLRAELTGGQFDGHEPLWFASPARLLMWLVCEDASRLHAGQSRHPTGAFTSVALDELEKASLAYRYRSLRALPVNDLIDSLPADSTFKSMEKQQATQ